MSNKYFNALFVLICGLTASTLTHAQSIDWNWATSFGGTLTDEVDDIATDGLGNIYATGDFFGTVTLGPETLTSFGAQDMFLVKYDAAGNVVWARHGGSTGGDHGRTIAVDAFGNAYVAGFYEGSAMFGDTVLMAIGSVDVFVVKYSPDGNVVWALSAGGSNVDIVEGIALNDFETVTITGDYQGTAQFGTQSITSTGNRDIYVARYDTAGNFIWVQSGGGAAADIAFNIAVDAAGNAYVIGNMQNVSTFGDTTVVSAGTTDILLVKYTSNGDVAWARTAGGSGGDTGHGITVSPGGDSYITGLFSAALAFDTETIVSGGSFDTYIAKYNTDGDLQWVQSFGGPGSDIGQDVALDATGNLFATGTYSSGAVFGDTTLMSNGLSDVYVLNFNDAGLLQWVLTGGGSNTDNGLSLALDGSGGGTVAGFFETATVFGATTLVGNGFTDALIVSFDFDAVVVMGAVPTALCPGDTVMIPFAASGSFGTGNVFTAQLSDTTGSFANAIELGSLASDTGGVITGFVSDFMNAGSGYRIRVVSSNPAVTGSDNGVDITSNPTPNAGFSGFTGDLCSNGSPVTLTPMIAGGVFAGTGVSGNTFDPTVAGAGLHNVSYTLTLNGCTGVSNSAVVVHLAPAATFTYTNVGNTYTFNTAAAVSYEWNFGDGTTSTEQNPTHTFAGDSVYVVSLTATSAECSNTTFQVIDL
ncbi:MAG TPA: PKD domain-containing protein, partial [Chitinophagales bacterium]|nr:PKD domain-containing protein [Chitinophagales bacterium]